MCPMLSMYNRYIQQTLLSLNKQMYQLLTLLKDHLKHIPLLEKSKEDAPNNMLAAV